MPVGKKRQVVLSLSPLPSLRIQDLKDEKPSEFQPAEESGKGAKIWGGKSLKRLTREAEGGGEGSSRGRWRMQVPFIPTLLRETWLALSRSLETCRNAAPTSDFCFRARGSLHHQPLIAAHTNKHKKQGVQMSILLTEQHQHNESNACLGLSRAAGCQGPAAHTFPHGSGLLPAEGTMLFGRDLEHLASFPCTPSPGQPLCSVHTGRHLLISLELRRDEQATPRARKQAKPQPVGPPNRVFSSLLMSETSRREPGAEQGRDPKSLVSRPLLRSPSKSPSQSGASFNNSQLDGYR